jgi:hypothetical protein
MVVGKFCNPDSRTCSTFGFPRVSRALHKLGKEDHLDRGVSPEPKINATAKILVRLAQANLENSNILRVLLATPRWDMGEEQVGCPDALFTAVV